MIHKRESTSNKKSTTTMVSSPSLSSSTTASSAILSSHTGQRALLSLQRTKEEEEKMRVSTTTATTATPTNTDTTNATMISTYPIPKHMIYSGTKNNRHEDGTNVLKLNKNGTLQPRRLSFTNDRRNLIITTKRIKNNMKRILSTFKSSSNSNNNNINNNNNEMSNSNSSSSTGHGYKTIPIHMIDRIETQPFCTPRFIQLQIAAFYGDTDAIDIIEKYKPTNNNTNTTKLSTKSSMKNNNNNNNINKQNNPRMTEDDNSYGSYSDKYTGLTTAMTSSTTTSPTNEAATNDSTTLDDYVDSTNSKRTKRYDELINASSSSSSRCLSIIYRSNDTSLETIDMIIPNDDDYNIICQSLNELKNNILLEQSKYTISMKYIQYYWTQMGKDSYYDIKSTSMSLTEFITLCNDYIHIPLSKTILIQLFKEECKQNNHYNNKSQPNNNNNSMNCMIPSSSSFKLKRTSTTNSNNKSLIVDKLTLAQIAVLIERIKTMIVSIDLDPIQRIWNTLIDTDPVPRVGLIHNYNYNKNKKQNQQKHDLNQNSSKKKKQIPPKMNKNSNDNDDESDYNNQWYKNDDYRRRTTTANNVDHSNQKINHKNHSNDDDDDNCYYDDDEKEGDNDDDEVEDGGDADADDDASLELSFYEMESDYKQSISPVAFLSFLRSQQKHYSITLDQVIDMIHTLKQYISPEQCNNNNMNDNYGRGASGGGTDNYHEFNQNELGNIRQNWEDVQKKPSSIIGSNEYDRLSKCHFISWFISDMNDICDLKKVSLHSDDMTQPLSSYWINTSHDTYVQHDSVYNYYQQNQQHNINHDNNNSNNVNSNNNRLSRVFPLSPTSSSVSVASTSTASGIQKQSKMISPVSFNPRKDRDINHNTNNTNSNTNNTSNSNHNDNIHKIYGPEVVDGHMYLAALYRGVRCLELDIWQDDKIDEPVVARRQHMVSPHSHQTTNGVLFMRVPLCIILRSIQYYLIKNPKTYPILLKIENHITNNMIQHKMAKYFYDIFGKYNMILKSPDNGFMLDATTHLPSPINALGKIIIIGKRPKQINNIMIVSNDDYDDTNDEIGNNKSDNDDNNERMLQHLSITKANHTPSHESLNKNDKDYDDDEDDDDDNITKHINSGYHVIGFDTKGPILSNDRNIVQRTPADLYHIAVWEGKQAQQERDDVIAKYKSCTEEVDRYEQLTAEYTQLGQISPNEVKHRAARAANRNSKHEYEYDDDDDNNTDDDNNNNNDNHYKNSSTSSSLIRRQLNSEYDERNGLSEEGVEVHEVLPTFVESAQDSYAQAAQDAMEVSYQQAMMLQKLNEAKRELERSENDLEMSKQLERNGIENAKKAATDARSRIEDAKTAKERVEQVREIVATRKGQSSSAGTVVQTALTEAKISEKRAIEAEARASRAMLASKRDRMRADEETKREELFEHETNDLHAQCKEASNAAVKARERLDKANLMHEKINEQIKLIERSSQYRSEKEQEKNYANNSGGGGGGHVYVRHGGSLIAKHEAKFDERLACRALIKEATEDKMNKDSKLLSLKRLFEERAHQWRHQADLATQLRRTADRSAIVAEELQEHAEEEREAATLRDIAREKALAAVEDQGTVFESVEAQLQQAERAAQEASQFADDSRKRADKLAMEVERIQDHSRFIHAKEKRQKEFNHIKEEYDAITQKRNELEQIARDEKQRLDTNSLVYRSTIKTAASESNRTKLMQQYQQEAIIAYNQTLLLRKEVDNLSTKVEIAVSISESKLLAVQRAKEYQTKREMQMEIPIMLAKMTYFHTCKFKNWKKSLSLSNAYMHSFSQNVLHEMILWDDEHKKDSNNGNGNNEQLQRKNIHALTRNHLCRVFPSWKSLHLVNNMNVHGNKGQSFPSLNNNTGTTLTTNIEPVLAWSLGCQLVGMNYHSPDETLLVGDGRFRQNGSCGYVLKPERLLLSHRNTEQDTFQNQKQSWSFCILGAYHLPPSIMIRSSSSNQSYGRNAAVRNHHVSNPFVKISLYEGSADETRILHRTKTALTKNNVLNPIWDSKEIFYFTVQKPDIAMISFTIWDQIASANHRDDSNQESANSGVREVFIAGSAIPVSCIQEGYRSISLFDINHSKTGPYAFSSLLVKASCNKK